MHDRKLVYDRQNLMHIQQSQVHLHGAGEGASILCCATEGGGGRWDTIASSAGEFGPISTVQQQDGKTAYALNSRSCSSAQLEEGHRSVRAAEEFCPSQWRESPVAITSSAGKFGPISTATHNGDSVVHTEQLQLQISRAGGATSILWLRRSVDRNWGRLVGCHNQLCREM